MGDVGVFSFYPTKVLTSGTGGILTTNNEEIYKLAKSLRLFGKNDSNNEVDKLGNDWFLDEFRSAICLSQLDMIESIIEKRSKAAKYYIENLPKSKLFSFLKLKYDQKSCWYNFPIFFKSLENKNIFKAELSKKFISSKSIYRPVFEEKVFLKYNLGKNYKTTKEMLDHSLCLPMYTSISKKDIGTLYAINTSVDDDCDEIPDFADYFGTRLAKVFKNTLYSGSVTKYLAPINKDDVPLWQIVYDDDDKEQWEISELKIGATLFKSKVELTCNDIINKSHGGTCGVDYESDTNNDCVSDTNNECGRSDSENSMDDHYEYEVQRSDLNFFDVVPLGCFHFNFHCGF